MNKRLSEALQILTSTGTPFERLIAVYGYSEDVLLSLIAAGSKSPMASELASLSTEERTKLNSLRNLINHYCFFLSHPRGVIEHWQDLAPIFIEGLIAFINSPVLTRFEDGVPPAVDAGMVAMNDRRDALVGTDFEYSDMLNWSQSGGH